MPAENAKSTKSARTRLWSSRLSIGIASGALAAYLLIFYLLYPRVGAGVAALAMLPTVFIGWLWGTRAGLIAGLLSFSLNTILLNQIGYQPGGWDVVLRGGGGPGTVALILIGGIVGRFRDLRDALRQELARRQEAEAILHQSEAQLRGLLQSAPDAMVISNQAGQIVLVNAQTEQAFGYTRAELLGQSIEMLLPARLREPHVAQRAQYCAHAHARPVGAGLALFALRKDGSEFPVEISLSPLETRDGLLVTSSIRDISQRQQTEAALQASERRYRSVVDNANDIIYRTDQSGHFTFYNPTVSRVLGYDATELLGRHYLDLVVPAYQRDASHIYRRQLAQQLANTYFEFAALAKDGTERWVGQHVQLLLEEDQLVGFQAVARDISERKQVEEALRQSEETFASAFTHATIGMALVAPDGRWLKVNQALCALVGYREEELLARTFQDITHPADLESDLAHVGQMLTGEIQTYQMEKRYLHRSGTIIWVLLSVSLVRDEQGQPRYFISQIQDIGERKRVEQALRRQNAELAALSRLGQALSRLAQPAELLEVHFAVIGQILDNRNLYVALYDEANQEIAFPIYTIDGQRITRPQRPFSNGLTEHVIQTREPLLLPRGVEEMARTLGIEPRGRPSHCFLAVPMLVGDKVVGVIGIQDYEQEAVYDEGHREVLTTIAAQAAIALENARLFTETAQLARTDPLTGIANRRYLFELGARELSRARRFNHPLAALMTDIDHFKRINDTRGHAIGDQVLQTLARLCQKHVRDIDLVGRYGGEELVILLVETDVAGARMSAERLRAQIAATQIETDQGQVQVTVSIGVAGAQIETDGFATLVVRADAALYVAKQSGRNRVEVSVDTLPP